MTTTPSPVGAPRAPSFDQAQTLAFLKELSAPLTGCVELRVFHAAYDRSGFVTAGQQYSRTYAGWYDDMNNLTVDASRLKGVSGYVTVNPVSRDLLARSDNAISKAKHTTTDADVLCLRWLYVDIDPVRPADISSTDEELRAAVSRRDAILGDFPEIAASSMYGRSGNGAWLLVRLNDLPNDDAHRSIVGRMLTRLSGRYSDNAVKVDPTTRNPSRVMCIPGCVKTKGSNRPERPWRMTTIDGGLG